MGPGGNAERGSWEKSERKGRERGQVTEKKRAKEQGEEKMRIKSPNPRDFIPH